jgi:hypothetical protein
MSQRLFGQTPSWNLRLPVFCSLYLARSHAQQLGKFGVSLIPMASYVAGCTTNLQPELQLRWAKLSLDSIPNLSKRF